MRCSRPTVPRTWPSVPRTWPCVLWPRLIFIHRPSILSPEATDPVAGWLQVDPLRVSEVLGALEALVGDA